MTQYDESTVTEAVVKSLGNCGDPRFRQFIRSSVVKLFPPQTEDDRNEPCLIPGC